MSSTDEQLRFLEDLRPLARSDLPFSILRTAVRSPRGITAQEERTLRSANKNSGRAFTVLADHALLRRRPAGGWMATRRGRGLVSKVEKASDSPPSTVIEGRRLLLIGADASGGIAAAEDLLANVEATVLYSDGHYELVAVLEDDIGLANSVRRQLRQLGHSVETVRIVASRP